MLVWYERDRGVFDRMDALGPEFMGPQHPAGRRDEPTPQGLPEDTRNVQTFESGQPQLDYVFASWGLHHRVKARAMNQVGEWGSSDHCRVSHRYTALRSSSRTPCRTCRPRSILQLVTRF